MDGGGERVAAVCGFLGIASESLTDDTRTLVRSAAQSYISHRGPDGHGRFDDNAVSLECYRLALNGGSGAAQPYRHGKAVLGYNGEVYMIGEHAVDIAGAGGDIGAVAAHLNGAPSAGDLDGMFAIAQWSPSRRQLTLLRDRFGIKPLYWAPVPGGIAFGSQSNGVRHLCGCESMSAEAIVACLSLRGPLADQPMFAGVSPLAPGQTLTWARSPGALVSQPYDRDLESTAGEPSVDLLEDAVVGAVESTLAADAEVGLCLSGGLDSSLIAAIATHAVGSDIPTYVLASDTNEPDVEAALMVADHLGLKPQIVQLGQRWPEVLEEIVPRLDEPPTTESTVGVAAIAEAARRSGVKALLSGEGADEVFGGYNEYRTTQFTVDGLLPELHWLRANVSSRLCLSVERFANRLKSKIEEQTDDGGTPGTFDYEARLARLLRRLDNAMMAYGVEGRVPYLVAPVVAEANKWTWKQRTEGLGKGPLRAVARRWLPAEICDRPKSPFASGVRARPEMIANLLERHRDRLLEIVTPECLDESLRDPQDPQSWKLAALGLFLATHRLRVEG